ncbi:MAG: hypothetical protein M3173_08445 [Chloroflexota bacterium]|nr:hypothetical protein [Chloroflexota bacterium]
MATKHGKERCVSLPFRLGLGAQMIVAHGVDTDLLGTFTGEVPRVGTPREVAVRKARLGMAATGLSLGLASEGSFSPDPFVPYLPIGQETLVFVDDERGIEVHEQIATMETNFGHAVVSPAAELDSFLDRVGFPVHGVIVRPHRGAVDQGGMRKGLQTHADLEEAIQAAARSSDDGLALVETDMRAHLNPTRARVIRGLAFRLALRLRRHCPRCGAPGWGRVDVEPGLPCSWCATPTEMVLHEVYACTECAHRANHPRSDGLIAADPAQCSYCNP